MTLIYKTSLSAGGILLNITPNCCAAIWRFILKTEVSPQKTRKKYSLQLSILLDILVLFVDKMIFLDSLMILNIAMLKTIAHQSDRIGQN